MKKALFSFLLCCFFTFSFAQKKDSLSTGRYIPFARIEKAPIYPGCETLRENLQRLCLQTHIKKHVARNFNMSVADSLNLEPGKKRVYVQFVINKNGYTEQIRAKGPGRQVEEEAVRVVSLLPQMIPAKQSGENVNVKYTLPITFQIDNKFKKR